MSSTLGTFLTTSHLLMLSQTRYDNSLKYHVLCHLQLCAYMVPSDCSAPSPGSLPLVLLITQLELSPFPNCFPTFPPWGRNVLTVTLGRLCFNLMLTYTYMSSPTRLWMTGGGASGKEPTCKCRRFKRPGIDPWVEKIPWRRAWEPILVFLPGESHRQRSQSMGSQRVGYDWATNTFTFTHPLNWFFWGRCTISLPQRMFSNIYKYFW